MKMHHIPSRWLPAAVITAAVLLTLTPAWGQTQGAGAMFEGRPAMAGAQGGQGAQAGMPQGGLGVQGSEAQRGLNLRKPSGLDAMPPVPRDSGLDVAGAARSDATLKRDAGLAKEQRSSVKKAKRATKRSLDRAKTGSSEIDTSANPGAK